jgi:hypothetical protein
MKLQSEYIVVNICLSDIFCVDETWYFLCPVVFSHCGNLFSILSILLLLFSLTEISNLGGVLLILFHVLDVSFNLGLKGIERIDICLGVNCDALILICFLHEKLNFSNVIV